MYKNTFSLVLATRIDLDRFCQLYTLLVPTNYKLRLCLVRIAIYSCVLNERAHAQSYIPIMSPSCVFSVTM